MGLMNEYITKRMNPKDFERELNKLINEYCAKNKTYLLVLSSAINKQIPDTALGMDDYYIIYDLLKDVNDCERLDVYLETPGGSGEAAEEIVRFFRDKFKVVNFIISGEAKSAGTIMALSADDIFMTKSGSLGPIDAQVGIGRMVISAHDYKEWIDETRKESIRTMQLNPFDATITAQISPGELNGVLHALKFAEDLVIEWLPKYKFKNWNETSNKKTPVTSEIKRTRAEEIAKELTNHGKWRSHGRSLKIRDLESIGLRINCIDDDPANAEIVYRIQTLLRLFFTASSVYKYFGTKTERILKQGVNVSPQKSQELMPTQNLNIAEFVNIDLECTNCKKSYQFVARLESKKPFPQELLKTGASPLPKSDTFKCECGTEIDLGGIKTDLETQSGKLIQY